MNETREVRSDQNTIVDALPPSNDPQQTSNDQTNINEKSPPSLDPSEGTVEGEGDGIPKVGEEHGWDGVPDGGLRAWLVVLAVCPFPNVILS